MTMGMGPQYSPPGNYSPAFTPPSPPPASFPQFPSPRPPKPKYDAKRIALLSVLMLVLVVSGIFLGNSLVDALAGASAVFAHPTPASVLATATTLPSPTAISAHPRIVTGPTFGGTSAAFTAAFGAPTKQQYGQTFYAYSLADGTRIDICFCDATAGADQTLHVDILHAYPDDSTQWSTAIASQLTQTFLPPDAVYQRDVRIADGSVEHVYRSADLAATFPADDAGGIVSVDCSIPDARECGFVVGE
ncbi:MAG TPA: hypothetical protein VKQ30_25210 [Ktedonobacterales bacterium]|nr:hypothetical protein [Ktedonobacterales bacterium]